MTDITIPPEALEAAARAAVRNVEEAHSGVEVYKKLGFEDREAFIDAAWPNYIDQTRAACLAMLKNWPRMSVAPIPRFRPYKEAETAHHPPPAEGAESMSDIVKRLRWRAENTSTPTATTPQLCAEAADTITSLRAEVERLKEELDIWKSVFPDIAPERVLPDRSKLEAENEKLRAALKVELADHEEAIAHDAGGLEYASLVGVLIGNADSLAQSVRYHERRAKLIRAALEEKQ